FELPRAANKTAHASQRFAARMNGDQNAIGQAARGDEALPLRAYDSGGVGFVNDELGTISFRERNQIGDWRPIAIHAENAFGDNEFLAGGRILVQLSLERIHIAMRENYLAGAGKAQSVDDAGMIGGI